GHPRRSRERGGGAFGGWVVDAAGPVPLDVRVPADRTGARAFPADVAAKQQHVDDLADRVPRVLLLGHAQAPADDGRPGLAVDLAELTDLGLRYAGLDLDLRPGRGFDERSVGLETRRVMLDELTVERLRVGGEGLEQ